MSKRVDANHGEIVKGLRAIGATVRSTASVGVALYRGSDVKRAAALLNLQKANAANRARHALRVRAFIICLQCGKKVFCKPREVKLKTYCSRGCETEHYKTRLCGSANPNFKNAGARVCENCNGSYKSYSKNRKFCSERCYRAKYTIDPLLRVRRSERCSVASKRPRKQRKRQIVVRPACPICKTQQLPNRKARTCGQPPCRQASIRLAWDSKPRTANIPTHRCIHCQQPFQRYGVTRLYCSYQCFVASGGPFRAGLRASQMTQKYGAKKDANHKEIFDAMRAVGTSVIDLSQQGCGVPDGVAWISNGWQLFEVKNPKTGYGRRGLNQVQKKWLSQFSQGGPVYIIRSVEQAIIFARGGLDRTERVTSAECTAELLRNVS